MVDAEDVVTSTIMAAVTLLTIVGNSLVILAWFTRKSLQTPANAYIVSLAFADLLLGSFVTPTDIPVQLNSEWTSNPVFCQTRIVVIVILTTVSIFHLIAISWDRYRTVIDGVQYIQRRTIKSVMQIVLMIWIVSIWIALPPVLDWNQHRWSQHTCRFEGGVAWVVHSTFGAFIFPTFVMVRMYTSVYFAIKERLRKRAMVQEQNSNTADETEESLDQGDPKYKRRDNLEIPPSATGKSPSPMKELAEKKLKFSLSKERKAAKMLGIIIFAFLLFWLPFFTFHFFGAIFPSIRSARLYRLLAFLGHANSAVNPFIYAVYNREFKEEFKRIVSCGRK